MMITKEDSCLALGVQICPRKRRPLPGDDLEICCCDIVSIFIPERVSQVGKLAWLGQWAGHSWPPTLLACCLTLELV